MKNITFLFVLAILSSLALGCSGSDDVLTGCMWYRMADDDRQMCTEDLSYNCTDMTGLRAELWYEPCPNDPAPSQPDSTCNDAAGNFWAYYFTVDGEGHAEYCAACDAATLSPADFCQ